MPNKFSPIEGAAGFQLSNPSVIDTIALYSSLLVFKRTRDVVSMWQTGNQQHVQSAPLVALREKSVGLTGYLEMLLTQSMYYVAAESFHGFAQRNERPGFTIITPREHERRGAQLSLLFTPAELMPRIFDRLCRAGVLGDERQPGVIRLSPAPLYNTHRDVCLAARALDDALFEEAPLLVDLLQERSRHSTSGEKHDARRSDGATPSELKDVDFEGSDSDSDDSSDEAEEPESMAEVR